MTGHLSDAESLSRRCKSSSRSFPGRARPG